MSIDPVVTALGSAIASAATTGLDAAAAAAPVLTGLPPAGADPVSIQAATAFAAEGAAVLTANTAAQDEIARVGAALTEIAQAYTQVDGTSAADLSAQLHTRATRVVVAGDEKT